MLKRAHALALGFDQALLDALTQALELRPDVVAFDGGEAAVVLAEELGDVGAQLFQRVGLALLQLGLGFVVLWWATKTCDARGMVGMSWLLLAYLLHTTGELCLSPVGLSMVTNAPFYSFKVVGSRRTVPFIVIVAIALAIALVAALRHGPIGANTIAAIGAVFVLIGAFGMLRMPDVYTRMHAASVIDTLGAGLDVLLISFAGALLGFLYWNRSRARLFMGDAGSYFVGFCLAVMTIQATFTGSGLPRHAILAPLCVLVTPVTRRLARAGSVALPARLA